MSKHKEISKQTKQNLIDAFWSLYTEKRIEKITVKEITEKAGYNRSTFYEYFLDVYDVLEQIEQSLIPDIKDMPPIMPDVDVTTLSIDSFIKMYAKQSKYYTVLLGDNGDPAFATKIKNSIKEKLKGQFLVAGEYSIEVDYALEFMLSAMIGVLSYWFKNEENLSKERLIALMYNLMGSEGLRELAKALER